MKLITAIFDKKAKCIGRPIFQENIEKAIQGVTDAFNSTNTQGEYLMPAHREHPEDYCLIQLGYLDEEAEITAFNAETGKYYTKPKETPFITIEQKTILEFKDIEKKDIQQKISAETVYQLIEKIRQDEHEAVSTSLTKEFEKIQKFIEDAKPKHKNSLLEILFG